MGPGEDSGLYSGWDGSHRRAPNGGTRSDSDVHRVPLAAYVGETVGNRGGCWEAREEATAKLR